MNAIVIPLNNCGILFFASELFATQRRTHVEKVQQAAMEGGTGNERQTIDVILLKHILHVMR